MTTQEIDALGDAPARPSSRTKAGWLGASLPLVGLSLVFLLLATQYVPRLSNNIWSDVEFSGWVAALAHRLHLGGRMYEDIVLPIPPGAIWLLAKAEQLVGRPAILTESWACAICHLLMGLIAYAIAAPFTSRRTALLVSGATLAFVIQLPKELLYDHTAQVVSWGALALLAQGLVSRAGPRRSLFYFAAGLFAGLVCVFKQSTAVGTIGAGGVAIAYLALISNRRGQSSLVQGGLAPLALYGLGVALGLLSTLGFVVAIDGHLPGFLQTVFRDGSALKGGWKVLLPRMLGYPTIAPTVPLPLLLVLLGSALVFRLVRVGERLVVPSPEDDSQASLSKERAPIATRDLAIALGISLLAFGGAAALLASGIEPGKALVPGRILQAVTTYVPALGLALGVIYFVANFPPRPGPLSRADALSALLLAAIVAAIGHNGSVRESRFFYDNNAIIAVSLLCLFLAIEKAKIPWLRWAAFAALMLSVFGGKMTRYLDARTPVQGEGYWAGMSINQRGEKILAAAERARELAGPDETVLVLPEDISFAMLIGRPRPELCGAIAFVDQYPARCLADDLKELETSPPKVIVLYPSQENEWQRMYRLWSNRSPAGFLNRAVMRHHLPARYRLDSSYPSVFWGAPSSVEIYVRND